MSQILINGTGTFKQSKVVMFSSVIKKQCSPSVYTELFTQVPEVSMINGDRIYCRTLKGSHALGLPSLISSHKSENYAWHIEYYPRSQKSKQIPNSEVMTSKLVKICIIIWHGPGALLIKDVCEEVFYWFQLLAPDSIWAIPSNINTCVVPLKVHKAAWEIVHALWWFSVFLLFSSCFGDQY